MSCFFRKTNLPFVALGAWLLCAAPVFAGYKDDIGWTKLAAELGGALPDGAGVGVSQIEAQESAGNFGPNTANSQFSGKTFTNKSGAAGNSGHATTVGGFFYGKTNSVAPMVAEIDIYEAGNWIGSGFLRLGSVLGPRAEIRAVQNHSWIGSLDSGGANDIQVLRRFDAAIEQSQFLGVVGLNNNNAGNLPALLAGNYNGISVGLTNGAHSHGTNTADGAGRTKPELVAPESFTSFSTPMVSATAAMLWQNASANGRKVVAMKSILLAGATKTQFPGWSRTTTRPIDAIFGAGQLNAYRSYHIMNAGEQEAGDLVSVGVRGWNLNTTALTPRMYFFDIPAGNTASDFSALITWNRSIGSTWPSATSTLANLTLKLYAATGFTPGAMVDSSESAVDNIEHIYRPSLAPGRYALEVTSDTLNVEYGIAWYSQPTITIAATDATATELGNSTGAFTLTRSGSTDSTLAVAYTISGSAANGVDFQTLAGVANFAIGASTATVTIAPLSDALAEGDETVTLTISSAVNYSAGAANSASVVIADLPVDAWRFSKFTAAELGDAALSGDEADFDGDGIRNLMEYALFLEPKSASVAGLPVASFRPSGALALTFTRVKVAADISYIVEVANEVGAWNSGAGFTSVVETMDEGATERITVESLLLRGAGQRQFVRLRINRP